MIPIVYPTIYIILYRIIILNMVNFDIKNLIENKEEEKKYIYVICKKFLDMIFFDGDTYIMN